jgi:hypothetical protein
VSISAPPDRRKGYPAVTVTGGEEGDDMKYVLLIYADEKAWAAIPPEQQGLEYQKYVEYSRWLEEQGLLVGGDALEGTDHATTVRVRDGKTSTTDGPFAETKEQLGGYYLIEADDLDAAIDAAARCPGALYGSMEVRPLLDMS